MGGDRLLRRVAAPPDRAGARAAAPERRGSTSMSAAPRPMSRSALAGLGHEARDGQPRARQCARRGRGRLSARATASTAPACRRGAGRMGLYFLSPGAGPARRPRSSTTARAAASRWPAPAISTGTRCSTARDLLHLSGITPALGPRSAEAGARRGRGGARGRASPISFDGNYRAQLWQRWDSDPRAILTELVGAGRHPVRQPPRHLAAARPRIRRRRRGAAPRGGRGGVRRLPEPRADRLDRAPRRRRRHATASPRGSTRRDGARQTEEVVVAGIVDRIGAGDAFAAGVLHGLLAGRDLDWTRAHAGLALTCLKHSLPGDASLFGAARHRRLPRRRAATSGADRSAAELLAASAAAVALAAAPALRRREPRGRDPRGPRSAARVEGGLSVFRGIRYGGRGRALPRAGAGAAVARRSPMRRAFGAVVPAARRALPAAERGLPVPQRLDARGRRRARKRPVMVYFHGGAYSTGSVADPLDRRPPSRGARRRRGGDGQPPAQRASAISISRGSIRASPTAAMPASST